MSIEDLTTRELIDLCVRENISAAHRSKSDLVERLHQHYEETCTATPDKIFFDYLRKTWKEAEKMDDKSKEDHFKDCIKTWQQDIPDVDELTDYQQKALADLEKISRTKKPGEELLRYYRRGEEAWLADGEDSDAEDSRVSGDESNYSDDKDEDESSDEDNEDEDVDEDADEEEEDEEGADEEEEEEEVEVDLDLSPEGTWAKASELRKVDWIKNRKWVALMGHVLKDKPRQGWTMKRFLHEMCRIKKIAGYRKNLTAKKCGELLDNVGVVEQSVQTPVSI